MTRSGRSYTPEELELRRRKAKGKETEPAEVDRQVTKGDIEEFLKLIQNSEYSIVEQLSRMPAQISIMSLLASSEVHRKTLLKVLNQAHVPSSISTKSFQNLVGQIPSTNIISFTDV